MANFVQDSPARGIIASVMKRLSLIIFFVSCLLAGCSKIEASREDVNHPGEEYGGSQPVYRECNAIVTVKQDAAGSVFFQLDDDTCLYPVRYTQPFTRQCRIICGLAWWSNSAYCQLNWMDYLQEGPVESGYDGEGDGVDVLDDWMTSVEDGYLTLHYSAYWGNGSVAHSLMLVTGENPQDPYEVRLVHLNNGDTALVQADALIYFDLAALPWTEGSGRKLTLKWKNGAGEQASRIFLYKSRQ